MRFNGDSLVHSSIVILRSREDAIRGTQAEFDMR
jgi:hypothetical protein